MHAEKAVSKIEEGQKAESSNNVSHALSKMSISSYLLKQEKSSYQGEIQKIMFISGEVVCPNEETVLLIENIVKSHVSKIIQGAFKQAARRGSNNIIADDIVFLIRHDKQKVNRLKTFLSYKEAKKSVKKSHPDLKDINPEGLEKMRKKIKLSRDLVSHYRSVLSEDEIFETDLKEFKHESKRLEIADKITRIMMKGEYVCYSGCKKASFTYKKLEKFRKWCGVEISRDTNTYQTIMEILGFVCYELVMKITKVSLLIKRAQEVSSENFSAENFTKNSTGAPAHFFPSKTCLQLCHVYEAYRKLQRTPEFIKLL